MVSIGLPLAELLHPFNILPDPEDIFLLQEPILRHHIQEAKRNQPNHIKVEWRPIHSIWVVMDQLILQPHLQCAVVSSYVPESLKLGHQLPSNHFIFDSNFAVVGDLDPAYPRGRLFQIQWSGFINEFQPWHLDLSSFPQASMLLKVELEIAGPIGAVEAILEGASEAIVVITIFKQIQ